MKQGLDPVSVALQEATQDLIQRPQQAPKPGAELCTCPKCGYEGPEESFKPEEG